MAKLYAKLILAGRKSFADVPDGYKNAVKIFLEEKVLSGEKSQEWLKEILGGD